MKPVSTFTVRPLLPEPLKPLLRLAYNLRWSWDAGAVQLFLRLARDLWESSGHNPIVLLGSIDQAALEAAARDDSFLAHLKGVAERLDLYLSGEGSWYRREHQDEDKLAVAYFSAEFGIAECLSIFAGGLGVLAGDHLKAASDLGLPLVGVGLAYQQGYFRQYLNAAGWQQEAFEDNDFHTLPIVLVPDVKIQVEMPEGPVTARVWSVNVGRLKLFLLDTNIPENPSPSREITHHLYGGDLENRIVPMFYERRADGMPSKWIECMKSSVATLCPEFNMHRMVTQYADEYYLVAHRRYLNLCAENSAKAKRLASWLGKVETAWPTIKVDSVKNDISEIRLGERIVVSARIALNALTPEDVAVQVLMGQVDAEGEIKNSVVIPMQPTGRDSSEIDLFEAVIKPTMRTGLHGYSIRVLPQHPDLISSFVPELIVLANPSNNQEENRAFHLGAGGI